MFVSSEDSTASNYKPEIYLVASNYFIKRSYGEDRAIVLVLLCIWFAVPSIEFN